jgi:formylmethanofuran dehydrogenase subunit C
MLSPDVMVSLTNDAIRALPVYLGKRQRRVDDFFDVAGEASDELEIRGDATKVKWIGRAMSRGQITISGNAGMHTGAYMKGGRIEVSGNVSDWLGGEMSGGLIRVRGNAGGQIGAAYRGSLSGMTDGTIIVDGAAGLEVGMRMKRGMIAIGGPVRDFAGLQMKGGTLIIQRGAELRTGAWMNRGTIISLTPIPLLPTFSYASTYNPTFLRLFAKHLNTLGFTIPYDEADGAYLRYTGDAAVPGRGELLIWQPRA